MRKTEHAPKRFKNYIGDYRLVTRENFKEKINICQKHGSHLRTTIVFYNKYNNPGYRIDNYIPLIKRGFGSKPKEWPNAKYAFNKYSSRPHSKNEARKNRVFPIQLYGYCTTCQREYIKALKETNKIYRKNNRESRRENRKREENK